MFGYNSTISKKMKVCKNCNKLSYIFSNGRCVDCARIEDTQKRMAIESEVIIKEENLSEIIGDADAVFSRYIRYCSPSEVVNIISSVSCLIEVRVFPINIETFMSMLFCFYSC